MEGVRLLVGQRDEFKAKADTLEAELQQYRTKGQTDAVAELTAERDRYKLQVEESSAKAEADAKSARRKETADAIVSGAKEAERETFGLVVDGLAARGKIDLSNPDNAEEIRKTLAKDYPQYFGPVEGQQQQGVQGPQGLDLSNLRYEDMTPEMRASLSPEQYKHVLGIRPKGEAKLRI